MLLLSAVHQEKYFQHFLKSTHGTILTNPVKWLSAVDSYWPPSWCYSPLQKLAYFFQSTLKTEHCFLLAVTRPGFQLGYTCMQTVFNAIQSFYLSIKSTFKVQNQVYCPVRYSNKSFSQTKNLFAMLIHSDSFVRTERKASLGSNKNTRYSHYANN